MMHNIYVCLECKLAIHGASIAGRHAQRHGHRGYDQCLVEGIFIDIGECPLSLPSGGYSAKPCLRNMQPATGQELKKALEIRAKQKPKTEEAP